MIRMAKLTDYGLVLLTVIARNEESRLHTARDLAAESRLPLPTVSKILKLLLQNGVLESHRGIRGGYSLARRASDISIAEVVMALEGEIATTDCGTKTAGACEIERRCPIKANQRIISQAIRETLERLSISDLTHPMHLTFVKDGRGNYVSTVTTSSGKLQ